MGLFSKFNNKQAEFQREGVSGNQNQQMAQGYNPYTGNVRISPNVPSYNMQSAQKASPMQSSYKFDPVASRPTTGYIPTTVTNDENNQQRLNDNFNNFIPNYNNPVNRPVQNPTGTVNTVERPTPNQNPYRSFNDNNQSAPNPQPVSTLSDPYSALNPSQISGQNSPLNQVKIDVNKPEVNKNTNNKPSLNSLQNKINSNTPAPVQVDNKSMDAEIEKEFNKLFDSGELDSKDPVEGLSLDINDNESLNLEIGNSVKPEQRKTAPVRVEKKVQTSSLPLNNDDEENEEELERKLEEKFDRLFNSNTEVQKTKTELSSEKEVVTESKEFNKISIEINNKLAKILDNLYGDVTKAQARKAKTDLKNTFLGLMDKLDDAIREKELAIKEKEQKVKEAARKAREAAALEKEKAKKKAQAAKEKEKAKAAKKVTASKKTTKSAKASKAKSTTLKKATKKVTPKKTTTKKTTNAKTKKATTAKKATAKKVTKAAAKSTRGRKKSK